MKLRRPTPPTLAAAIARYLAEISPAKKSAHTEQSLARRWLATRLASRPIDRIRNTAMRRSELCGIRREHVDLRTGTVWLADTKNGQSRIVPLTPWAQETLRRWLAGRPMRGRVFTMSPEAVTRAFIRARRRARSAYEALCQRHGRRAHPAYFRDLRFHDLRHEATSRLAPILALHEHAAALLPPGRAGVGKETRPLAPGAGTGGADQGRAAERLSARRRVIGNSPARTSAPPNTTGCGSGAARPAPPSPRGTQHRPKPCRRWPGRTGSRG